MIGLPVEQLNEPNFDTWKPLLNFGIKKVVWEPGISSEQQNVFLVGFSKAIDLLCHILNIPSKMAGGGNLSISIHHTDTRLHRPIYDHVKHTIYFDLNHTAGNIAKVLFQSIDARLCRRLRVSTSSNFLSCAFSAESEALLDATLGLPSSLQVKYQTFFRLCSAVYEAKEYVSNAKEFDKQYKIITGNTSDANELLSRAFETYIEDWLDINSELSCRRLSFGTHQERYKEAECIFPKGHERLSLDLTFEHSIRSIF